MVNIRLKPYHPRVSDLNKIKDFILKAFEKDPIYTDNYPNPYGYLLSDSKALHRLMQSCLPDARAIRQGFLEGRPLLLGTMPFYQDGLPVSPKKLELASIMLANTMGFYGAYPASAKDDNNNRTTSIIYPDPEKAFLHNGYGYLDGFPMHSDGIASTQITVFPEHSHSLEYTGHLDVLGFSCFQGIPGVITRFHDTSVAAACLLYDYPAVDDALRIIPFIHKSGPAYPYPSEVIKPLIETSDLFGSFFHINTGKDQSGCTRIQPIDDEMNQYLSIALECLKSRVWEVCFQRGNMFLGPNLPHSKDPHSLHPMRVLQRITAAFEERSLL